jgi:hypothetical protein
MRFQPLLEVVDGVGDAVGVEVEVDERLARDLVVRLLLQIVPKLDDGRVGLLHVLRRLVFGRVETDQRVADHAIQLGKTAAVDLARFA